MKYKNITGKKIPSTWKYRLEESPEGDMKRYGKRYNASPKEVFNTEDLDEMRRELLLVSHGLDFAVGAEHEAQIRKEINELQKNYDAVFASIKDEQEKEIKRMIRSKA